MFILILAVVFPVLCGVIVPVIKRLESRAAKLSLIIAMQALETVFCLMILFSSPLSTGVWRITDSIGIGLSSDGVAKLFCSVICIGFLLVFIYATVYMKHEENEESFFMFALLTEGAMIGASLASGLVLMYVFYEFVTLFSFPLVLHSRSEKAIAAAKKYLFYSIAGAFMALFGIFVLNANAGTLDFIKGGSLASATPVTLVAVFVLTLGFGAKAGMFPLHGWLPSAHPVAPAPASALLSAIIAKAGVLAVIRTLYFVVSPSAIVGTWVQTSLIVFALLTVLLGSVMAYNEKVLKKRLAYSTVSQVSYVFCGLFLFTGAGVSGAVLQIIFHAAVKAGLFLCAGAVIFLSGKTRTDELSGLGRKMPVTFAAFTVLSLSLIGIPPTGGFISKWNLATASLASSGLHAFTWIIPTVLLISALFTAGYLLPVSIQAFLPSKNPDEFANVKKEPVAMVVPLIILCIIAVAGGIFVPQINGIVNSLVGSIL
ncbi:MAG: complex I subunit 5 family protein [Eubacteriales bacterium]